MRSSWRRDGKRISEAAEADAPLFTTHTAECSAMRGFSDLGATHQGAHDGGSAYAATERCCPLQRRAWPHRRVRRVEPAQVHVELAVWEEGPTCRAAPDRPRRLADADGPVISATEEVWGPLPALGTPRAAINSQSSSAVPPTKPVGSGGACAGTAQARGRRRLRPAERAGAGTGANRRRAAAIRPRPLAPYRRARP